MMQFFFQTKSLANVFLLARLKVALLNVRFCWHDFGGTFEGATYGGIFE